MGLGTARTGIAAVLWQVRKGGVHEIHPPHAEAETHILSTMLSAFECVTTYDGRFASGGLHAPGMATLVPAGSRPRAVLTGSHSILHFYVPHCFLVSLIEDISAGASKKLELIDPRLKHEGVIAGFGREVLSEMREGCELSRLRIDALGQELAIHLLRRWSNFAGTPSLLRNLAKGGLAPWQVKRLTDYMEDHLADDVSLEDLSKLLDLSTFHVCRAFKQSTGLPPHRWRHQRRIERARELLEGTDLPVTEVAAQVGYDDPSQLAVAFRKVLGVSPSQYRRDGRS